MKKYTSFKEFAKGLTEGLVDKNKFNIAQQSLLIDDQGARVAGAMPKHEAVKVLRDAGIGDEEIRRLVVVGGASPAEVERLMKK